MFICSRPKIYLSRIRGMEIIMKNQDIFKRYEIKYLISYEQEKLIRQEIEKYIRGDEYGKSSVCNIYYDTPTNLLIRRSIEKPVYKEKLRVRSYGIASAESKVYIELKKKYNDVVYKRRISQSYENAQNYLEHNGNPSVKSQITNEIDYFCSLYENIAPAMFISYEREAFYAKDDDNFRITFDRNILWRNDELSLDLGIYGNPLLSCNETLMEIKTSLSIPLWMSHILNENKIYKTSFSKYGNAYKNSLMKGLYVYA